MNEYVGTLPEDTHISIFMFDSERWLTYYEGSADGYPWMKTEDHVPGAATPLYDACAKLIAYGETKASPGDRVMVMVDTDGKENASKEHTQESIKALVETRKAEGWAFLFMSEGLDRTQAAINALAGSATGMNVQRATVEGRMTNYRSAGMQTTAYLSTGEMPKDMDNYEEPDKPAPKEPAPVKVAPEQKRPAPAGQERTEPAPKVKPTYIDPKTAKPWAPAGRTAETSRMA